LTSSERLLRFVARHTQKALGRRAADGLRRSRPLFSNAPRRHGAKRITVLGFVLLAVTILCLRSAPAIEALAPLLCTVFLGAAGLRLLSVAFARRTPRSSTRSADHELPIYTIICALYREANVVAGLVAAIRSLDYPPEKLDVKLVLEADDHDTRRALARLELGPPFEIITAPLNGPRTKPKALNVALPFARGSFTVVYDAEDVPEPDQLRRAVDTFMAADKGLACVQAADGRQHHGQLAGAHVHSRLRRPVRCFPARPGGAAPAVSAWRLVEPFSYGRVAPSRRLGPL
jgi:Glycosyltransferase like family 2